MLEFQWKNSNVINSGAAQYARHFTPGEPVKNVQRTSLPEKQAVNNILNQLLNKFVRSQS